MGKVVSIDSVHGMGRAMGTLCRIQYDRQVASERSQSICSIAGIHGGRCFVVVLRNAGQADFLISVA
jgi:hypothetical protein